MTSLHLTSWFALAGSILLSSFAQIALKRGMNTRLPASGLWRVAASPWVMAWALCFAAATVLWIIALRSLDLSYAYPMLGSGYVLVTAMAAVVLRERVSSVHWVAVVIIAIGVACIARSV